MPTYEYRCPEGHEFEQFVLKISAAKSELPCPTCGLVAPRRMSVGGGLLFKGSGFYITDYGKDGKKAQPTAATASSGAGGADAKAGDAKGSASESKGESKGAPSESTSARESATTGSGSTSGKSTSEKSTSSMKPEKSAPASVPKSGPAK